MRVLLAKKERKEIFYFLQEKYNVESLKELAVKINIPYKTINNWRYDYKKYIPRYLIEEYPKKLYFIDEKPDNWGQIKGGKIGGINSVISFKNKLGKEEYYLWRKELGKKTIAIIQKKYGNSLVRKAIQGRMKRREIKINELELKYKDYFTNQEITFDNREVIFSRSDKNKGIILPKEMSVDLAEEIGVHLGDGCLREKRNYFSVKTNKIEEKYMVNFLFPLYKRIYNINLKLMRLPSVVGFESYSKAISEFKNKVLKIPKGKKIHRIEVPRAVLETKNKEIYSAFIRGLFDTDGCAYISTTKNNYPIITITIKSAKLINQVKEMFLKIGFIPYKGEWVINLNGKIMIEKWLKEIGSNNPKNLAKLKQACSVVDSTRPCGGLNLGSTPSTPI